MTDVMNVACNCPICGEATDVTVSAVGYANWIDGELIQNALPTLTSSEREALITGICDTCWDLSFGEEE